MYNNELYHYGVKGQKWGVRRYQNSDGTLTMAGKKRALSIQQKYTDLTRNNKFRDSNGEMTYAGRKKALKMREEYGKVTGGKRLAPFTKNPNFKPESKNISEESKKKSIREKSKSVEEMSNEELRSKITRKQLEMQYSSLYPKKVSAGKKFVNRVVNNIVLPAGEDVARQLFKSEMTKAVNNLKGDTDNKKK